MVDIDVLVIGGGHAGVEAAAAAARRGATVALVTFARGNIGAMSCNPSIGGLGKGHLVREVDACDGLMARAADAAAIHYRMLNRSKGAAVRGPRVQADRRRFSRAIQQEVDASGIRIIEGEVIELVEHCGEITGVRLAARDIVAARAVVLATGTFLGARMFRGAERMDGGRIGERAATELARQLESWALPMARMKTGTPPRLDGRSIDWARITRQPGDAEPWTMSPMTRGGRVLPQLWCGITSTTNEGHDVIRQALDRSPMFDGAIRGTGPRYCPSIEDKVHRFGDRDGHQLFLEPEGLDDWTIYPNGISTSLPSDIQERLVHSIPGLSGARITAHGYAVEYDHVDPRALDHALAMRSVRGLYCAGQINGTTGYEEAAAQGLVAGANAAASALNLAAFIPDRQSSYIGVLIDDLVLQGVSEPYRMLTARAEYRLRLRSDNAETRLWGVAEAAGLLGQERREHLHRRAQQRESATTVLDTPISASMLQERGAAIGHDGVIRRAVEWLGFPGVEMRHVVPKLDEAIDAGLMAEIVEDARYAPYVERQRREVDESRKQEQMALPPLDFARIPGLSAEMVERLNAARPESLGAAGRIRGITPAALTAILLAARRITA
ncbi:tRNA uridine-5-carboxymethylaminomethyl(34) synthesis enzyme MnmG [uncultured Sphingomonas sp.]|uniref:tRNA uridine-5-carboxymethylaminomethyl(34) synthesis enzyme MnmG n=1 Tax=uncultured Sphingomonas sp. TaxID=158754 RepID=UPI0035CC2D7F